jgi:hypothetical protein
VGVGQYGIHLRIGRRLLSSISAASCDGLYIARSCLLIVSHAL